MRANEFINQLPNENSLGQPITDDPEALKNFWNWFRGSKVVDAQGRPLVVYHGTGSDFKEFMSNKVGQNFKASHLGFYFTNAAIPDILNGFGFGSTASEYATNAGGNPTVMPVYLSLKNPLILDDSHEWGSAASSLDKRVSDIARWTKKDGQDGVIIGDGTGEDMEIICVAFSPNQIKSATGNKGTFNPNSPNITEARRNPEQNPKEHGVPYFLDYIIDNIPHSEWDRYGVHMSDLPKLGINPKSQWSDTPIGVYFYPLDYYYKMKTSREMLPYADSAKYIHLFKYDDSYQLDIEQSTVNFSKMDELVKKFYSSLGITEGGPDWDQLELNAKLFCNHKNVESSNAIFYKYVGQLAYGIGRKRSRGKYLLTSAKSDAVMFNKILRYCGIPSVIDNGKTIIHSNEPTQGVILDPSIIQSTKLFENKRSNTEKDSVLINRVVKMKYEDWKKLSDDQKTRLIILMDDLVDINLQTKAYKDVRTISILRQKLRRFNHDDLDNLPDI
jgi:hypothetical protein